MQVSTRHPDNAVHTRTCLQLGGLVFPFSVGLGLQGRDHWGSDERSHVPAMYWAMAL